MEYLYVHKNLVPINCLLTVVLAIAYFLAGWLGLSFAIPPGYATAVWPPSGIALVGILWWGQRVWLGIWLGSFLVNVWGSLTTSQTEISVAGLAIAATIAFGSTLQALLGALLLKRWVGVDRLFERGGAILRFAMIEALSCLLASTWGVTSLCLAGAVDWTLYFDSWRTWWLGDLMGVVVITPVLLGWRALPHLPRQPWRIAETVGSTVLLVVISVLVFLGPLPLSENDAPLAFMPLPCLVWIAFRFQPGGVALAASFLSAIAVFATSHGTGPFVHQVATGESIFLLQTFTGLSTLTSLTLAAAVVGQKQAEEKLLKLNAELEQRVHERTAQLQELAQELEVQSLTDALTDLGNRRAFQRKLTEEVQRAVRYQMPLSLLLLDVDHFKTYNDAFGHSAGDAVLKELGLLLRQHSRTTDFPARYGGEEFALLLPHTDKAGALILAERIRQVVAATLWRYRAVTVSIGAMTLAKNMDSTVLIDQADRALYEAKRCGRNCVVSATE
ncbi:MAG: diguanylate cyclase [Acaryochloris sp. RU_4_1]|nr:diguanylate cyclase [Acaryochloris sp. SU_5_25]NJM64667.1 diguanylate cyclase [Acaryochloris sp. RU_4_1]NJR53526.1 diguanylate cyclase [Acaryochloris sp. CRU_2_0]